MVGEGARRGIADLATRWLAQSVFFKASAQSATEGALRDIFYGPKNFVFAALCDPGKFCSLPCTYPTQSVRRRPRIRAARSQKISESGLRIILLVDQPR